METNQKHKVPDYKELIFIQNENRSDIYDLQNTNFRKFKYFRISKPRVQFLVKQGAKYVIENWEKGQKILFTGLIPYNQSFYFGDHKNAHTGKKSFIIVQIKDKEIKLYYFNSFNLYPNKRLAFIHSFLKDLQIKNGQLQNRPLICSNQNQRQTAGMEYKNNKND